MKPTPRVDYAADLLIGLDKGDVDEHRLTVDQVNGWLDEHKKIVFNFNG